MDAIAMDSQWNHEANSFAMDNNDYEKAFESYISDVDDDEFDGGHEYSRLYQPEQHQEHPEDHQQINEIFIEIPPPNIRLDLCPVCSRKFSPESLMKHVIICEKINTKQRKPFDSSKQRLHGTEFTAVVATSPTVAAVSRMLPAKYETRVSPPKTLQRKASETSLKSQPFERNAMLSSSMSRKSSVSSLGGGTPRPKRSEVQKSEKCPYCERVFGFKAFDRHVEWCKEKALIKPNTVIATVSAAKERMQTRINYKAPSLRAKRSTSREKYSSCNGSNNSLADFDSHLNSMSSSMTSEHGLYDPFLSAKKQLEELFSPTTTPTTQMINSMMTTPANKNNKGNDIMSKSLTLNNHHVAVSSPKTPQPIPKMQSNFKRTSSLRVSNRKPKPAVYAPQIKSNIHCGITDDGPVSPRFVKATDYDELPIKSPYSAIKLCEQTVEPYQLPTRVSPPLRASPARSSPSPVMPSISSPLMRDKDSALIRKGLKLDLKNPNAPSSNYLLSKTDSLALFLKYENEMTARLSEKELKDKSNSLSKRSQDIGHGIALRENKLPDINGKPMMHQQQQTPPQKLTNGNEKSLISIDNLNKIQVNDNQSKSHSAPSKLINSCDNLPQLNNSNGSDKSRSPSVDKTDSTSPNSKATGPTTLRRKKKYNMDNILFDTDPEVKTAPSSGSDNSNNNSLKRTDSRISNTESLFGDFDFDQFIASFTDDDQFPIFKDYKMMMNKPASKSDAENNNIQAEKVPARPPPPQQGVLKNLADTKPIAIQPQPRSEAEVRGLEKLDNLCKMLSGHSDSDESNSLETDPSESQTVRSKSSADSAYGSLSRQSQSPFDHRKMSNGNMYTFRPTPPPPPVRQHLELKTTEIVLNPIKPPNFQETVMLPRNGSVPFNRTVSTESESGELKYSKFCHECGYRFVVSTAKFCIECGVRRIKMS